MHDLEGPDTYFMNEKNMTDIPDLPDLTYTGIHIDRLGHVYISAVIDELVEENVDHSVLLHYKDGAWDANGTIYASCGMWSLEDGLPRLINVGIDGNVVELSYPGIRNDHVDRSENGPSELVHLKAVEKIGNHIYTAGMARHVYRRDARGTWVSIDKGVFVPRNQRTKTSGFLTIGGSSEKEIYAAGLGGEIWSFNARQWTKEESPTNVALTCMTMLNTGDVCISGLAGTVICGRSGNWRVIQQSHTNKDFWSCVNFGGKIYLANYEGIYTLNNDLTDIELVNLELPKGFTTAYLGASDDMLWSVGHKDLACTVDGVTWTEVLHPSQIELN